MCAFDRARVPAADASIEPLDAAFAAGSWLELIALGFEGIPSSRMNK